MHLILALPINFRAPKVLHNDLPFTHLLTWPNGRLLPSPIGSTLESSVLPKDTTDWNFSFFFLPWANEDMSIFGPLDIDKLKSWLRDNPTRKTCSLTRSHLHCGPARPLQVEPRWIPVVTPFFFVCWLFYFTGWQKVISHRGTGPSLGSGVGTSWDEPTAAQTKTPAVIISRQCIIHNGPPTLVCSDTSYVTH